MYKLLTTIYIHLESRTFKLLLNLEADDFIMFGILIKIYQDSGLFRKYDEIMFHDDFTVYIE